MGVQEVSSTVVQIYNEEKFRGTGFFILHDYCVTCHHVIYGLDEMSVKVNGKCYDAIYKRIVRV